MKQLYILFLSTALPFLGFAQVTIAEYTFDTDEDGWIPGNDTSIAYNAANYHTALGSLELTTLLDFKVAKVSNITITDLGDYTLTYKIKGNDISKTKGIINQGSNVSGSAIIINTLPSSIGGDGDTWYEYSHTFTITSLADIQIQIQANNIGTYYIDDVSLTYIPSFTPTYNGFAQNPDFEDQAGGISPWSIASGAGTSSVSTDANTGLQAAKIDITADLGADNVLMENNYTLTFDAPKTVAASGDYVTITWDMKSNNTALAFSFKFTLGGAVDKSLFSAIKNVTTANTYESFSITKSLDAQVGITYNDINTLTARVQTAINSDWVIIDNVTTEVVIAGATLSVKDVNFKDDLSISLYPNPVQNILNINAPSRITKIEVYNVLGQKVILQEKSNQLDVSKLRKGTYISKIFQENDVISTKRFLKN